MNWPTPTSTDQKGSGAAGYSTESGRHSGTTLTDAVRFHSHPVPVIEKHGEPLSPTRRILRRRLNQMFVCWLMGWPTWWTYPEPISFAAAAMASWRSRLRSLCDAYCGEPGSEEVG